MKIDYQHPRDEEYTGAVKTARRTLDGRRVKKDLRKLSKHERRIFREGFSAALEWKSWLSWIRGDDNMGRCR